MGTQPGRACFLPQFRRKNIGNSREIPRKFWKILTKFLRNSQEKLKNSGEIPSFHFAAVLYLLLYAACCYKCARSVPPPFGIFIFLKMFVIMNVKSVFFYESNLRIDID